MIRRCSRFAGRNRAGSATVAALLLALAVGGGYLYTVFAHRSSEADRLLQQAYNHLVYLDYRAPELVQADIEQAALLGADPTFLTIVQAIAALGSGENQDALSRLRDVVRDHPDLMAARYLLAWTQWRMHQLPESRATFDEAESLGGAQAADEWFFRGLAVHFDRPALAIESYEQANAVRAAQHLFFPQAVLHLARSYNQRMYATRDNAVFEDAQGILLQLIKQGHYGAYPHYLLSISQRMAGEISAARASDEWRVASGEGGFVAHDSPLTTHHSSLAEDQFRAALDWARLGQIIDPTDDRSITAEAECLERLGMFEEAIEARTRAIATAKQPAPRCEGYHYRWRLHFWTDALDEALADMAAHAQCIPESDFYAHVYPSWIHAQMGDMERALGEARQLALEAPDNAQAVLWSVLCLQILGRPAEANEILLESRPNLRFDIGLVPPQTSEWVQSLYDFVRGLRSLDELVTQAAQADEPRKLLAEAYFYAAIQALGIGDRTTAQELLSQAYRFFDSELRYTFHAKTLLTMFQLHDGWPAWIAAHPNRDFDESSH